MAVLEWFAIVVAVLAVVVAGALGLLFFRRSSFQKRGAFDMCLRVGHQGWSDEWVFGMGRYRGGTLEWFRTFSFAGRPKRAFGRHELVVRSRRSPDSDEAYDLPGNHLIFQCVIAGANVEVSMTEGASMAFLAWIEAAPPGGHLVA